MALQEYRRKRDFGRTAEPRGRKSRRRGDLYVIHKHAARRLHYDLRLEHEGVLLSWAVPKGPSLDPADKRLAVEVEPHPVEYGEFEGMIPEGTYGGGPSALWDRGRWEPLGDVAQGLADGKLRFRLRGERLQGVWNLVRSGGRGKPGKQWLLIKSKEEGAEPGRDPLAEGPDSVKTGRSLEQIAAEQSELPQAAGAAVEPAQLARLPKARRGRPPAELSPELATLVKAVPGGENWLHEIKFDGYRMLCRIEGGAVRLVTRNGKDWTERFTAIAQAAAGLPEDTVLDGEVVVLRRDGTTDFQALQNAMREGKPAALTYYCFDLPYCAGVDLRATPLSERKQVLAELLAPLPADGAIRYSDHLRGQGETMYREGCRRQLEGIISKRADSPYVSRRSRDWLKSKCALRQEFVIGGYTAPKGSRSGFGALLLGYHDRDGKLRYAGKVGTGFTDASLRTLTPQLQRRGRKTPPFADPPTGSEAEGASWVTPQLVAEVEFTEWTGDDRLRHPSFQGLREDKPARQIVREQAAPPAADAQPKPATPTVATRTGGSTRASLAGVTLSNADRVLFPEQGVTKQELADYYAAVAEGMLPHVAERPLTLVRCPQGRGKQCFYQRHLTEAMPAALHGVRIREKNKQAEYVVLRDLSGLIALVQLGVLELHPWGARADRIEHPDRLIFDLDPGEGVSWAQVKQATAEVAERLRRLGLESYLKATGGKGLHVVVPLSRRLDWDTHKAFSKALAVAMERDDPRRYTANMSKAKRRGRIFIDYLRNGRGATAIAPYSSRARPGAPVAVPLGWDELAGLSSGAPCSVESLPRRLAALEADPWEGFFELRQSVTVKMRRALGMRE